MRVKKNPRYARVVSLLLCLALAATLIPTIPVTLGVESGLSADGKTYYIKTFNDLMMAAGHSKTAAGNTIRYVLCNDIAINDVEKATLQGLDIDHLSFGDKDHYFLGEFDGGGHTISGLDYANKTFKVATRTGLFSYVGHTDSAQAQIYNTYIHDLTIKGASMHADYLSGIVAGEAYNTRFVNVNVVDSAMSVNPADNAVLLITDGGVIGGAIAGFSRRCTFYNCGTRNTTIRTNSVSGVAALAGKPLYLGGLVGQADTFTEIEYCRVMGGAVKNRYESSVGAVGGFTCYAGGLAGKLEGGTKVIDCFASCDVSFHAATYVGVGAGCSGHAGGLVGKTDTDDNGGVTLRRCHYAGGTISSYQYNTLLLMIPVQIAHDVNRSGLVDKFDTDRATVTNCYFNYADGIGPENGKPANVLGDKKTSESFGPQPDEQYMDRSFWESRGYDFAGNVDRSTGSNTLGPYLEAQPYYNKWVMYYYDDPATGTRRGYPVHGLSVAATFDFPGAGTAALTPTLGEDSLSREGVSTTDPYRFAVLGIYPTECTPVTYTDGTPTKGGVNLSITMNPGYRLVNWYLEPDVAAAGLPSGQHEYFEKIFADESKKNGLAANNTHVAVEDNQLYVAYCQALVEFHDLTGVTLNTAGAAEANIENDYYDYATPLPNVTPQQNAPSGENVKLIGWTTRKHSDAQPGWAGITTSDLKTLQDDGVFYLPGDPITQTLQLYPVYADQLMNIKTQIEGYDSDTNKALRAGVGETHVKVDEAGQIVLNVKSLADPANQTDVALFPDGYRFLGWYENNLCVSRSRDYTLPDTVDLNTEHIYEARFEYRVDYYAVAREYNADHLAGTPFDGPCAQLWQLYNSSFNNSETLLPVEYRTKFDGWHEGTSAGTHSESCADVPTDKHITAPYAVHEHVTGEGNYDFFVVTDFPGSGTVSHTGTGVGGFAVNVIPENGNYKFLFWAAGGDWTGTSTVPLWEISGAWLPTNVYGFEAHMTADVVFHAKDKTTVKSTVKRRYEEKVLLTADASHTYTYPLSNTTIDTTTLGDPAKINPASAAAPADMTVDGYYFIGWLDWDDPDTAAALTAIYNVTDDPCTTTNVELAKQYILDEEAIVTRAMPNVYPVYAKYDIETDTNVELDVTGVVNQPANPAYSLADGTAASTTVTVTAYDNVPVKSEAPDGDKYTVEAITVSVDGGKVEVITDLTPSADGKSAKIKYDVLPGKHYLFTAIYQPHVVIYHQNGTAETEVLLRTYGQPIGRPAPKEPGGVAKPVLPTVQDTTNELDQAIFVGWTETRPDDPAARPYHYFPADGDKTSLALAQELGFWTLAQTEDIIVTRSMQLWPVFASYTITVNSNIDKFLRDKGYGLESIRSLKRTSTNADAVSTIARADLEGENYKFAGWYTGVKKDATDEYNDFSAATLVSDSEEFALEGSAPFTNQVYTARYRAVYKVIYHGRGRDGGPVIHTDYLYEGRDEDKSLNILRENVPVKKPVLDENGNPTYDENGEPLEQIVYEDYHEPLNPIPYHMIYAAMDANESFGQWECHKPGNPPTEGELVNVYPMSFRKLLPQKAADGTITDNGLIFDVGTDRRTINLYPTVWTVTVTDSTGKDITDQLVIDIDMKDMQEDYSGVRVYVCFDPAKPYTQDKLTVRVQRTRWRETGDPNAPEIANRGRNNVTVIPYLDNTRTVQLADSQTTANLYGRENDEANDGYAVFNFSGNNVLRLTKAVPMEAKGDVALFQVTDTTDPAKTWQVPVTCAAPYYDAEDAEKQVGWQGYAELLLPMGTYSVEEVSGWQNQYTPTYQVRSQSGVPVTNMVVGKEIDPTTHQPVDQAPDPVPVTNLNVPITAPPLDTSKLGTVYTDVFCLNTRREGASSWLTCSRQKDNRFTGTATP